MEKYYRLIVMLVTSAFIVMTCLYACESNNTTKVVLSYQNKLTTAENKLHQSVSQQALIEDSRKNTLKIASQIHADDSLELKRLSNILAMDKLIISATAFTTKTQDTVSSETSISFDTVSDDVDKCNPIYSSVVANEWDTIRTVASRYGTHTSYVFINQFDLKQSRRRVALFRFENYAEIVSLNPNTVTTGMRSFVLQQSNARRFGVGGCVGASLDNAFKIRPSITFGVTYTLIPF